MRILPYLIAAICLPALSQSFEVRMEQFKPHFQELPAVSIVFGQPPANTGWNRQEGKSLSAALKVEELGPFVDLRVRLEIGGTKADGYVDEPGKHTPIHIDHKGVGLGLNWLVSHKPSGFALEMELMERVWNYTLSSEIQTNSEHTSQTWTRLGVRWALPFARIKPFVSYSFEWIFVGRSNPDSVAYKQQTQAYLRDQHAGQHMDQNQCLGFGISF